MEEKFTRMDSVEMPCGCVLDRGDVPGTDSEDVHERRDALQEVARRMVWHAQRCKSTPVCEPAGGHEGCHNCAFSKGAVDVVKVKQALGALADRFQGTELNELEAFADGRPSAERVVEFVARQPQEWLPGNGQPYPLTVTEAPGCSASFYPSL